MRTKPDAKTQVEYNSGSPTERCLDWGGGTSPRNKGDVKERFLCQLYVCKSLVEAGSVAETGGNTLTTVNLKLICWTIKVPYKWQPEKDNMQEKKCPKSPRT